MLGPRIIAAIVVVVVVASLRCTRSKNCDYAANNCASGTICAHVEGTTAECVPYVERSSKVRVPVVESIWCSQGGRSARARSHSFAGDIYAVDIVPASVAADVAVVAPVGGTLYVFDDCDAERDSTVEANNTSRCGLGYGNHVKIWDGEHVFLLAHFARIEARAGEIKAGERLGTVGVSGAAGHRHVHLTLSKFSASDDRERVLATAGWKASVPVRFRLDVASKYNAAWTDELPCGDNRDVAPLLN